MEFRFTSLWSIVYVCQFEDIYDFDNLKQLGLGDVIDRNVPSQVTIDGCVPKKVACGWWHTLLLAESPT